MLKLCHNEVVARLNLAESIRDIIQVKNEFVVVFEKPLVGKFRDLNITLHSGKRYELSGDQLDSRSFKILLLNKTKLLVRTPNGNIFILNHLKDDRVDDDTLLIKRKYFLETINKYEEYEASISQMETRINYTIQEISNDTANHTERETNRLEQ